MSFVLVATLGGAVAARYYALEPVQVMDASMSPRLKEQSITWVCKLPQCIDQVQDLDLVLIKQHSDEFVIRKILATPGDSITISDKGKVITPHRNFKWKGEDAFIQSRSLYVPKVGDTLYFDQLNDVEQDFLIAYLHSQGEKVTTKTSLWQGDREISIDRVGSTKIANRQVSLKEIDFLPWQDRYLIELQIRRSEPGNSPIKLKRKLYRQNFKNTPVEDSLQLAQDSLNVTEEILEEINQVVVEKDCYFLACEKGSNCSDSREYGYLTKDHIVGLHLKKPDEFKKKFIDPTVSYLRGAYAIANDLWHMVTSTWDKAYNFAKETFKPKATENEGNDSEGRESENQ